MSARGSTRSAWLVTGFALATAFAWLAFITSGPTSAQDRKGQSRRFAQQMVCHTQSGETFSRAATCSGVSTGL